MKNTAFSMEELFRFLDAGVSAFHSTAAAAAILEAEGYVNCPEGAGPRRQVLHHPQRLCRAGVADAEGGADRLARRCQPQ